MKKLALITSLLLGACSQLPPNLPEADAITHAYEVCRVVVPTLPAGEVKDKLVVSCDLLHKHGEAVEKAVLDVIAAAETVKDAASDVAAAAAK